MNKCAFCKFWQQQIYTHTGEKASVGSCELLTKTLGLFNSKLIWATEAFATGEEFGCTLFRKKGTDAK